jgi:hypothetical protein
MAQGKNRVLYHIKKETRNGEERTFFNRHGRAIECKDGSFNVWIESLPVGMTEETVFNLRVPKPRENKEADAFEE